ncbi:hypothetical protein F5Y01DRAFT_60853 [Xylaria sp. FL0043]|nr:hypothetical protein F5Y01DRAFT_60853 [Xylaria sp. FL0043]
MAQIHCSNKGVDLLRTLHRLEELYKSCSVGKDGYQSTATIVAAGGTQAGKDFDTKDYDPSTTIPRILLYLRDYDAEKDVNWNVNFPLIRGYIAESIQQMKAGALGYSDPKLRAALEDAHVMVGVHLDLEKRARETTPWAADILRGQSTQNGLLTYPKAYPLPEPDRAKSQRRPVSPTSLTDKNSPLWNTTLRDLDPITGLPVLAELDNYVDNENKFFEASGLYSKTDKKHESTWKYNKFVAENSVYEGYIRRGTAATCTEVPPSHNKNSTGSTSLSGKETTKGRSFYNRRGWQRAALQQCLNLFTSHENRVVDTPWRRPVLACDTSGPLPKHSVYAPRLVCPENVLEKEKDPFPWLHWSFLYGRTVDWLAECQRRRYISQYWADFSAAALPINFRGPHIYRGLAVHDQHWLAIGEQLENIESMLHRTWGAAPRPFLRAILRDIDAGRRDSTGGPNIDNSLYLPAKDNEDRHDKKCFWRRDIKRRIGIDTSENNTSDDNYMLVDEYELSWLRYLCEPSRTLEMCDPSKLPAHNLVIIFDAKLQSFFKHLELSGTPDSKSLDIWDENRNDSQEVMRTYKPNTLQTVLAYINGCAESELALSGETDPNPEHPNSSYQFSIEEAESFCIELEQLGRCVFMPGRGEKHPARVDRPRYNVHPEDRIMWRYEDLQHFQENSAEYLNDMLQHYDVSYSNWSLYDKDRPRFAHELEFMMDHAGSDFPAELERIETQHEQPGTAPASARRRELISRYIVPEGLCCIGAPMTDNIDIERDAPHRDDLAPWETVGDYLTKYRKQVKGRHASEYHYHPGEPHYPQTPERTVQFFRNIAYRMGRTSRYAGRIKERLQYLENNSGIGSPMSLDLSADLKQPLPKSNKDMGTMPTPMAEKWWKSISARDYDIAVENWNASILEGSGEVALVPPNINEVLEKADPDASFQNPLKGDQDPYTIIREGIIDDCFRNRPTMYPGRLSGFKDQEDKEFQEYERPNLFVWATKDQRRYQAQHTRRHFFNMQRWPAPHVVPHRLDAIQARKDEVLSKNLSKPDQAYRISTDRLPIGKAKPLHVQSIVDHHRSRNLDGLDYSSPGLPKHSGPSLTGPFLDNNSSRSSSNKNNNNNVDNSTIGSKNTISINTAKIPPVNINPFEAGLFRNINNNMESPQKPRKKETLGTTGATGNQDTRKMKQGHVPFRRSDEKFAPGPAVYPMGDTLLQRILLSEQISSVITPKVPFYKQPLSSLGNLLKKVAGGEAPLVPLVPPVARSNIPRSNPRKRKMPIEFLNSSGMATTKRFRSDLSAPLQPGGSGGQFAAATMGDESVELVKSEAAKSEAASPQIDIKTVPTLPGVAGKTSREKAKQFTGNSGSQTGRDMALHPLRVFPNPSKQEALDRIVQDFPRQYATTQTRARLASMYASALLAIEVSFNQHSGRQIGLQTGFNELSGIVAADPALAPLRDSVDNFDIHCANRLVENLGKNHGVKLQLGVVHEDDDQEHIMSEAPGKEHHLAAYLVGSRNNAAPDKHIVWVRLKNVESFPYSQQNPYNQLPYNNYAGMWDHRRTKALEREQDQWRQKRRERRRRQQNE